MEKKTRYHIVTYKFRLHCSHMQWLYKTREIYNLVLRFYYELLLKEPELAAMDSRQKILRQLELLTIGAKGENKEELAYPFPTEEILFSEKRLSNAKIPLYFRRAAINDAIRIYRSQQSRGLLKEQGTENFHASPIFYKGMYKEFYAHSICLKLWNDEKWVWEKCGLDTCGRNFPKAWQIQSPTLKLMGNRAMLHIPVKEELENVSTVMEQLFREEKICAVAFPNNDCLAVLVVLNKEGVCKESLFIRGGRELGHRRQKLLNRICKNRYSMGMEEQKEVGEGEKGRGKNLPEDENRHLKAKIRNLNDDCAHKISRQIVDFCEERDIGILVVPSYKQVADLYTRDYIPAIRYNWIGRRIIHYIRYKAFAKGIIVMSVSTKGVATTCHECGREIKRFNQDIGSNRNYYSGKNYACPIGHKGNAYFNEAMNVGHCFMKEIFASKRK